MLRHKPKTQLDQELKCIVDALSEAGYDPVEQLTGYVKTGKLYYITRRNGARDKIQRISKEKIEEYLHSASLHR